MRETLFSTRLENMSISLVLSMQWRMSVRHLRLKQAAMHYLRLNLTARSFTTLDLEQESGLTLVRKRVFEQNHLDLLKGNFRFRGKTFWLQTINRWEDLLGCIPDNLPFEQRESMAKRGFNEALKLKSA